MALLDKFTPEEIEQLKQELKTYQPPTRKDKLVKEDRDRLSSFFEDDPNYERRIEMDKLIYAVVDNTLSLFHDNPRYNCQKKIIRMQSMPKSMTNEYKSMFKEMVDLVERYKKPYKVWEKTDEDVQS